MPKLEYRILNTENWKKRLTPLYSKFQIQNSNKGFTLIEIMIALSIIGVLATIGIVSFTKTQETARDSRRKQDLRSIAVALELYRQKNGTYPPTSANNWDTGRVNSSSTQPWIPGLGSNYMNSLPKDPKGSDTDPLTSTTSFGYLYWAGLISGGSCPSNSSSTPGLYYVLITRLENISDKDSNLDKNYTLCDGTTFTNTEERNKGLFVLTNQ